MVLFWTVHRSCTSGFWTVHESSPFYRCVLEKSQKKDVAVENVACSLTFHTRILIILIPVCRYHMNLLWCLLLVPISRHSVEKIMSTFADFLPVIYSNETSACDWSCDGIWLLAKTSEFKKTNGPSSSKKRSASRAHTRDSTFQTGKQTERYRHRSPSNQSTPDRQTWIPHHSFRYVCI